MRALLTSLTVITAISLSSAAFAAQSTVGTIKSYNAKAMTLTLRNGTAFMLPAHFKDPGLKAGEKVRISYDTVNKKHEASAVTLVQ